jgi:hypothetical protein
VFFTDLGRVTDSKCPNLLRVTDALSSSWSFPFSSSMTRIFSLFCHQLRLAHLDLYLTRFVIHLTRIYSIWAMRPCSCSNTRWVHESRVPNSQTHPTVHVVRLIEIRISNSCLYEIITKTYKAIFSRLPNDPERVDHRQRKEPQKLKHSLAEAPFQFLRTKFAIPPELACS